ncbi:MAG TPA: hypothetical protein PKC43_02515 [Phycisphaerales bacterium]|nr:hypothetical protein [Phycisphaerales bacterium]HMP36299.1 hypothetical protein [Phycisphaerales bacterium]
MTPEQLRSALGELNGQRDLRIEFDHAVPCSVKKALLIPTERDGLVKVTDGTHVFLVDAERVAWIEIG